MMCQDAFTVLRERLPVRNKNLVPCVQEGSSKTKQGKDLALNVHKEHLQEKKDLKILRIAYPFVDMERIHQQA
ncbi:unnamed protein product, partial [Iphiclides podalirius]